MWSRRGGAADPELRRQLRRHQSSPAKIRVALHASSAEVWHAQPSLAHLRFRSK